MTEKMPEQNPTPEQDELMKRLTKNLPKPQTLEDWKRSRQTVETTQERIWRESEKIARSISPERAKELEIRSVSSFDELNRRLYAWRQIEGSQQVFDAEDVGRKIERVRKGAPANLITPAFGLRQKVDDLLKMEKIRGGLTSSAELEALTTLNKRIASLEMNAAMNPTKYDQMLRDARGEKERMVLSAGRALPDGRELLMQRADAHRAYRQAVEQRLRTGEVESLRQRIEALEYDILKKASAEKGEKQG